MKSYGVGQESGHYTMPVDEVDASATCLPEDFRMPEGADVVPVNASAMRVSMTSETQVFEALDGRAHEPANAGLPRVDSDEDSFDDLSSAPGADGQGVWGAGATPKGSTQEDDKGGGL